MARILVVEDNPTNLDLIVYLLQAFRHTIYTARSGEEGLTVAQREAPDLILLDVQMPVMDGFEVVVRLKAHPKLRAIPVVAVTALAMVGDRERVLAAGFDGYIAKPIDPESFLRQMQALMRTSAFAPAPNHSGSGGGESSVCGRTLR